MLNYTILNALLDAISSQYVKDFAGAIVFVVIACVIGIALSFATLDIDL